MSVQEYMDGAFPSKACIKRAIDSMFEPNPDFHRFIKELKRREEVRKKMAIDYREQWEEFKVYYRFRKVEAEEVGAGATIGKLMEDWIKDVIEGREKLMQEFVKQRLTTNIGKQDKHCYYVDIVINDGIFGRFAVSRNEFRTWLKNGKKGGK